MKISYPYLTVWICMSDKKSELAYRLRIFINFMIIFHLYRILYFYFEFLNNFSNKPC